MQGDEEDGGGGGGDDDDDRGVGWSWDGIPTRSFEFLIDASFWLLLSLLAVRGEFQCGGHFLALFFALCSCSLIL